MTVFIGMRSALLGIALLMSAWARLPLPALLCLLGVGIGASFVPGRAKGNLRLQVRATLFSWLGTASIVVLLLASRQTMLDAYYAALAFAVAAGLAIAATLAGPTIRIWWKHLTIVWLLLGALVWLAWAYSQNLGTAFYCGWAATIAILALYRLWLRPGGIGIQAANTLMLLMLLLPLADGLFARAQDRETDLEAAGNGYSYIAAHGNSQTYARWWGRYMGELDRLKAKCFAPDPTGMLRFRLRPDSDGNFFLSRVHINHRGFRGKEIADEKGNAYRIVALGESTTFGMTLTPEHRPWVELLEESIRQRLRPGRPVEVIDAGVPIYSLEDNLKRLQQDILPLKPDLIISYHGWNGFHLFSSTLAPAFGSKMPLYHPRPLRLLAQCEYRLDVQRCRRLLLAKKTLAGPSTDDVLDTRYGAAYEKLAEIAAHHHIRLALANYSMAVNTHSSRPLLEFYSLAFPTLAWQIQANQLHSRLVEEVARRHPEILRVDTHPGLDGQNEKFIDPMHFTPEGDRQLAETMFQALKPVLEQDLPVPVARTP